MKGFVNGLRHRSPLQNGEISRVYRRNFHSYASPWWISRPLGELLLSTPRELASKVSGRHYEKPPGRKPKYYEDRSRYYPTSPATLEF